MASDATFEPVKAGERIDALDIIRGFALLGIGLMNIEFFSRPLQDIAGPGIDPAMHGIDYAADALIYFFVQSKFWTLFSLLHRIFDRIVATSQQGSHARQQGTRAEWLSKVIVGTEIQAVYFILFGGAHGQHHHRDLTVLADEVKHFESIAQRQVDIKDDQVGLMVVEAHDRLMAIKGGHHVIASTVECKAQQSHQFDIIVHDQDAHAGPPVGKTMPIRAPLRCTGGATLTSPPWATTIA